MRPTWYSCYKSGGLSFEGRRLAATQLAQSATFVRAWPDVAATSSGGRSSQRSGRPVPSQTVSGPIITHRSRARCCVCDNHSVSLAWDGRRGREGLVGRATRTKTRWFRGNHCPILRRDASLAGKAARHRSVWRWTYLHPQPRRIPSFYAGVNTTRQLACCSSPNPTEIPGPIGPCGVRRKVTGVSRVTILRRPPHSRCDLQLTRSATDATGLGSNDRYSFPCAFCTDDQAYGIDEWGHTTPTLSCVE